MVLQTNAGGTDEFLKILDFKNGKFIDLNLEPATQLRGGWWTMPEYGSEKTGAYFKPAQLIVIQQIGGSDDNPKATVFRNINNKFQSAGTISMRELGDSIDKQLIKNKKD